MEGIALCIPAYNAEKYLPRLLKSAFKQQIPFNEILVYNDCSNDETEKIALEYGATVINGDINRGCSYGKNQLANYSKSEWLHFHDADDDILPNFTKEVVQRINDPFTDFDILLLNFSYIDYETNQILGYADHDVTELKNDSIKYSIEHKIVNFGIYKRNKFLEAGGFDTDEKVLYNEDNAFHQRMAKAALQFDYLSKVTCINYRYSNSMSQSNAMKCALSNYYVLAKTASTHGRIYPSEITYQLFECAAILASLQNWKYVRKSLTLARNLSNIDPIKGSFIFKLLTKLDLFFAFWFREKFIRAFKSKLRNQ